MESSLSVAQKLNISAVIREYGKKLKAFIRKRVRSLEDSEDILQEVYAQLVETDRMMKPVDQISGWLYAVARNRITDLYRKKKPSKFSDFVFDGNNDLHMEELGQILADTDNSAPEDYYLQTLIREEFEKALDELPPEQRMVFELNELMDVPFKDIALQTGETINTLISRKRYAVLYLRKRLRNLYDELLND
ncbi:MAG: sigma-70 family RNA polymerase sigma factor [Bacteroidetes bacterium]|nr:sigma-70 family RNA polymerase sigma factor [Bacteroidota bacterium]